MINERIVTRVTIANFKNQIHCDLEKFAGNSYSKSEGAQIYIIELNKILRDTDNSISKLWEGIYNAMRNMSGWWFLSRSNLGPLKDMLKNTLLNFPKQTLIDEEYRSSRTQRLADESLNTSQKKMIEKLESQRQQLLCQINELEAILTPDEERCRKDKYDHLALQVEDDKKTEKIKKLEQDTIQLRNSYNEMYTELARTTNENISLKDLCTQWKKNVEELEQRITKSAIKVDTLTVKNQKDNLISKKTITKQNTTNNNYPISIVPTMNLDDAKIILENTDNYKLSRNKIEKLAEIFIYLSQPSNILKAPELELLNKLQFTYQNSLTWLYKKLQEKSSVSQLALFFSEHDENFYRVACSLYWFDTMNGTQQPNELTKVLWTLLSEIINKYQKPQLTSEDIVNIRAIIPTNYVEYRKNAEQLTEDDVEKKINMIQERLNKTWSIYKDMQANMTALNAPNMNLEHPCGSLKI